MTFELRWLIVFGLLAGPVLAQETEAVSAASEADADADATATAESTEENGDGIESPRSLSGMSILGNEEAPKALVIIPWKSSELGDSITLSDTLDERAQPVDRDVFMRELAFYRIRSGE
jgi:hypothetical protein